jgi:hypothetical protein
VHDGPVNAQREWTLLEVELAVREKRPEAAAAIEWFWRNGTIFERHADFVRHARAWCEQPELRVVVERLRPLTPERKEKVFPFLADWLALTSALGRQGEILAWFDERVAAGDTPLPQMSRLRRAILERGRLEDWVAFADPSHAAAERLESVATAHENLAEVPELLALELEEVDCEVALWRRVAALTRPHQLAEVDAAIDASERAASIRAWLAKPTLELAQALTRACLD